MKTTNEPPTARRRPRSGGSTAPCQRKAGTVILLPALLASCLSDDFGSTSTQQSLTATTDPNTTLPVAPPPGEILDTLPGSDWTEGTFSVSDDGAAEYDLPLWVPDGRGGHEPNLSLHYNSRAPNGHLGIGWSLTGISHVRPCARTVNQDGRYENIGFVGTDALCLDGQRLRELPQAPGPGQREYRTENEHFRRIISYAAEPNRQPDSFKAWTKDGRMLTFGGTENARMRAYTLVGVQPEDPRFVRTFDWRVTAAWGLSSIEDRDGNTIDITYENREVDRFAV